MADLVKQGRAKKVPKYILGYIKEEQKTCIFELSKTVSQEPLIEFMREYGDHIPDDI